MHRDHQSGNDGSGNSDFGGPLLGGPGFSGKRPWFGRKRIGWGYSPQTWQGWLVTALMVAVVIGAGTVAKGAPWFFAVVVVVVAVPFVIIAIQRRGPR